VERELVLTGIGGQGIQLAAQVIARAALAEGRAVQIFGSYGGMMRGGNTEATVVFADDAVESPPTVGHAWSAILMHHDYSAPTIALLRPGSLALVNTSVFEGDVSSTGATVLDIAATELAASVGNPLAAAMVMAGAYTAATGLVALDSLVEGVATSLPPYRQQHVEVNVAALRAGFDATRRDVAPAWELSPC
jgi:Pyruvate/2-oxoacid:ferredoxin oxidoreductase gamma subunit